MIHKEKYSFYISGITGFGKLWKEGVHGGMNGITMFPDHDSGMWTVMMAVGNGGTVINEACKEFKRTSTWSQMHGYMQRANMAEARCSERVHAQGLYRPVVDRFKPYVQACGGAEQLNMCFSIDMGNSMIMERDGSEQYRVTGCYEMGEDNIMCTMKSEYDVNSILLRCTGGKCAIVGKVKSKAGCACVEHGNECECAGVHNDHFAMPTDHGVEDKVSIDKNNGTKSDDNAWTETDNQRVVDEARGAKLYFDTDGVIKGAKAGLPSASSRRTVMEMHCDNGHIGYMAECPICIAVRGSCRRLRSQVDSYVEIRPGYKYHCDIITWNVRSAQGNKYTIVLRDEATGHFVAESIAYRSDAADGVRRQIVKRRKDVKFMEYDGYEWAAHLHLDLEGGWRDDAKKFMNIKRELGLEITYSDPQDKRTNGRAENACLMMEVTVKAILA